jgi:hypothetical protein
MSWLWGHRVEGKPEKRVLSCRSTLFNPPEFIPAEAMGTVLPQRCPACKNCKECQFWMDSLSFQENTQIQSHTEQAESRPGEEEVGSRVPLQHND